jgi:hypothetical protein
MNKNSLIRDVSIALGILMAIHLAGTLAFSMDANYVVMDHQDGYLSVPT